LSTISSFIAGSWMSDNRTQKSQSFRKSRKRKAGLSS
jgi:hypothetical protein